MSHDGVAILEGGPRDGFTCRIERPVPQLVVVVFCIPCDRMHLHRALGFDTEPPADVPRYLLDHEATRARVDEAIVYRWLDVDDVAEQLLAITA